MRSTEGGTEKGSSAGCWTSRFKPVGGWHRQIRAAIQTPRGDVESRRLVKRVSPCFLEKPRREIHLVTVPETDTGGRAEHAKALEITVVKELGKMTP